MAVANSLNNQNSSSGSLRLPNGWREDALKNIAIYRRGSFPQPYGLSKWYDDLRGFPFIQVVDVDNNGRLKRETKRKISNAAKMLSVFVPSGSLIITIQGSIGRVALTDYDACMDRTLLVFEQFKVPIDNRFFKYALFALFEREKQSAPGGIIKTITKEALSKFVISFPPKAEQEAVANALSDADALIESLEKLITKKRFIKKGAMQELLTGKRRLPGFNGEWRETRIGQFTSSTAGGTPSTLVPSYWGGEIPWMASGDLHQKRVYDVPGRITEDGIKNSSTKIVPRGCVLIGLAGQGKTRGTAALNIVPLCTNQSIAAVLPSALHDSDFLFHLIDSKYEFLRELSSGDGGRGGLNLSIINNLEIMLPSIEEQQANSKVLNDFDESLSYLESKLAKAHLIKQGMMQELLTGRIRLI